MPTEESSTKYIDLTEDVTLETLVTIGSAVLLHGQYPYIHFEVTSAGGTAVALDQFVLAVQSHNGGTWETYIADWDALVGTAAAVNPKQIWRSANKLNTLAHGSSESAQVHIGPVYAIRFQSAQAGATASAVTITINGYASIRG
jgi:hypothetical protein